MRYTALLTREECAHTERRVKVGFLGDRLVLQAVLDIERVREYDSLLIGNALAVVEFAHHLDKVGWVARVLSDAGVDLGVGTSGGGVVNVDIVYDGGIRGSIALHGGFTDRLAEGL